MSDSSSGSPRAWAKLRFGIISRLLVQQPAEGELHDAIGELAAQVWHHPTEAGQHLRFGFSTIERWYYAARDAPDPIAVLSRGVRSDAGREKALSVKLTEALARQYGEHPGWTYRLHSDNLTALVGDDPASFGVTRAPSYPTVRRAMQRRGWLRKRVARKMTPGRQRALDRLERREVRSYEAPAVHALWHLDFHVGSRRVVDAHGGWHAAHLLGILDDASRVCCHLQWYLAESAENLVHGLEQAVCKRGLPRALMHDGGAAMIAAETQNGLLRLGIEPSPTLPYSPDQNGKQEVFWSQVEGRLMAMLERVEPLTLDFLNRATAAWVEGDYNHGHHEELGTTPIARMLQGPDVARRPPQTEEIRRAFTRSEVRTQRRSDGTVSVDGVRFELPSRLRTIAKPMLRWQSWDLSRAFVVDPRTDDVIALVRPLDKQANAAGKRRALEPVGDAPSTAPRADSDPIPPLLRKLMADYAASGLPPAYLPKDEHDHEADDDT